MNIPQLRFPEFKDNWNVEKMGDLYSFKVTNSFSRENLNYENGTVKNIHYGDIHTKFQTLFDITKETVPFINPEISIERISGENYCKEGDLILADASEDLNDVGKSIEVVNLNRERLLSGLHTILARTNLYKLDIGFSGYLFKSNKVRTKIKKEAQGSKVLSISVTRLSNLTLDYPSKPEQSKIVNCFTAIDEKLQFLKKKKSLLENYKKGIMQKLFSQELRFKDENGKEFPEWEEKKLEEIFYSEKGKGISKDKVNNNGKYDCILYGELYTKYQEVIFVVISKTDVEEGIKSNIGDLLIPSSTTTTGIDLANVTALNKADVLLGGDITVLRSNKQISNVFYAYYLSNHKKNEIANYAQGITIVHLYYSHIKDMFIDIPTFQEQSKIADFIQSIDLNLFSLNKEVEHLTNWKKGILQKMFC